MSLLQSALDLTEWFEVFPLRPDGKPLYNCDDCAMSRSNSCPTPEAKAECKCLTCHGFYRATDDKDLVREFWADDYLIGIRTGQGLVVLDFDKHGSHDGTQTYARWRTEGLLSPTVRALTGGGGMHMYYWLPKGLEIRNSQPLGTVGVDVKGWGGYVVAPPSRKAGAEVAYIWWLNLSPETMKISEIHPLLLEEILAKPEPTQQVERMRGKMSDWSVYSWMLDSFPKEGGNRNTHLFQASCYAGECVERNLIPESFAAEELREKARWAGLREGEINATIASGINRGRNNVRREVS